MRFSWLVGLGLPAALLACEPCGNTDLVDVPSPDGARHAVVFTRDCGATTGFSTQVSVLRTGQRPRGGGNALILDDDHGHAPAPPGQGPAVAVRWLAPTELELRYDGRARVFTAVSHVGGVAVTYVKRPT